MSHLLKTINLHKGEEVETYADLNGFKINGGTIPPWLCETEQRPDLVVVMNSSDQKHVLLIELTVPWDSQSSFKAAFERKTARYSQLALDLEERGWRVSNLPVEIGVRGSIDKRNSANIETISNICGIRAVQRLKRALSKIALLGSYRVYIARKSQDWNPGSLIEVSEHEVRERKRQHAS